MKLVLLSYRKMCVVATIVVARFLTVSINECFPQQPDNKSSVADTGNFTIKGVLLNKDGTPIKGETISILHVQDGRVSGRLSFSDGKETYADPSGKSDEKGKFTIQFSTKFIEESPNKEYTIGLRSEEEFKATPMRKLILMHKDNKVFVFGLEFFDKKTKMFEVDKLILNNDKLIFEQPASAKPASLTAKSEPIVLPSGLEKAAVGKAFNNEKDCEITEPLPAPIKFPEGTTQFAFQVVIDANKVGDIRISLDGAGMSEGVMSKNCNKYAVIMGSPQQYQWGATISSIGGKPLKSGTYVLKVTVDGKIAEVPFEIGK